MNHAAAHLLKPLLNLMRARKEELALYRHALQSIDGLSSDLVDALTLPVYQLENRGIEFLSRELIQELRRKQELAIEAYMEKYERTLDSQQQAALHLAQSHKQAFVKSVVAIGIPLAVMKLAFDESYQFIKTGLKTKDGLTLLQRIYRNEQVIKQRAAMVLHDGLIDTSSLVQITRNLKNFVIQKGTASVKYIMNRLSLSELKASYAVSSTMTMKELNKSGFPGTFYKQFNLSVGHPVSDECDDYMSAGDASHLGANVYTVGSFPTLPIHPHCQCYDTDLYIS